jgi:GT2 family glycosyltransferase
MPVEISVIIVAWNAKHYLDLCLNSLALTPPRRKTEVIVVDNASADDTIEMVESRYPWVNLIKSQKNLGFAKGNNLAIRQCHGRYIALVNPDVIVLSGCLDELADYLDMNPRVGNVGPRIFNPDMTQQSTCRHFPTLWNNFCSATKLEGLFRHCRAFAGEHMFYFQHDCTRAIDVIVGCFSMIRRAAFDNVGLLDEGLFMYGDDIDWCRRARNAGWEIVFYPYAQSIHDRGKTTALYPVRFAIAQQRSILRYWRKHHTCIGVLGIRGIILLHHLLRYIVASLSSLVNFQQHSRNDLRKRVSIACIKELFCPCEGDKFKD